jgi:hypothetical protein
VALAYAAGELLPLLRGKLDWRLGELLRKLARRAGPLLADLLDVLRCERWLAGDDATNRLAEALAPETQAPAAEGV